MISEFLIRALVTGIGAPGAAAAMALWIVRRALPAGAAVRYAGGIAFVAGFCAGYALLREGPPWIPERHWHWLPWLAIGTAMLGAVSLAAGVARLERWLLVLMSAVVAAWLLVPKWAGLDPPRLKMIPLLCGYLLLLVAALDDLPERIPGRTFAASLAVAAASVAAVIAYETSITQAQVAGMAAGALAGIALAFGRRAGALELRGMIPAYVVVVGGMAYVGAIGPREPIYALLSVPAAPLALWLSAGGSLGRLQGHRAVLARGALVALALIAALALIHAGRWSG